MGAFGGTRFAGERTDWETPAGLFADLDAEFSFTLDVAATAENAKCPLYFTPEQDGLKQRWAGVCWCNPPYGREMPNWLRKAILEASRGVVTVCLIPARTNTGWFHDYCLRHGEVRFVRGRPKFVGNVHGLPQPLAIVVFGRKP